MPCLPGRIKKLCQILHNLRNKTKKRDFKLRDKKMDFKNIKPAVYKFRHAGMIYYRLGLYPLDARNRLARELRVESDKIEILDGGKKQ
jgi:hypothetical protein